MTETEKMTKVERKAQKVKRYLEQTLQNERNEKNKNLNRSRSDHSL